MMPGTRIAWPLGRFTLQFVEPFVEPPRPSGRAYVLVDGSTVLDWGWTRSYCEDARRARWKRGRIHTATAYPYTGESWTGIRVLNRDGLMVR